MSQLRPIALPKHDMNCELYCDKSQFVSDSAA